MWSVGADCDGGRPAKSLTDIREAEGGAAEVECAEVNEEKANGMNERKRFIEEGTM